jgi:hypothetical protein
VAQVQMHLLAHLLLPRNQRLLVQLMLKFALLKKQKQHMPHRWSLTVRLKCQRRLSKSVVM